jgi:hypothetical protein
MGKNKPIGTYARDVKVGWPNDRSDLNHVVHPIFTMSPHGLFWIILEIAGDRLVLESCRCALSVNSNQIASATLP